jgi:hypothetical protein
VLGIASLIICSITMAEITNTKDFMKAIEEVRQEYPEDSIERKIPTGFIVTVAAAETGNFNFKNAPTAKSANNFFGMQASSNYIKESTENIENMFKGMSPYAERTDYPSFLANVYNDRIKPIIETENMLIPKRKPIVNQMNTLK